MGAALVSQPHGFGTDALVAAQTRSLISVQLMKAVQLIAHGIPGRFELRELPEPQPAPSEAVVQVHACGLNRLDLWLEEGGLPMPLQLPRTPGCEIAGRIVAVGSNCGALQVRHRVAVQSHFWCGPC